MSKEKKRLKKDILYDIAQAQEMLEYYECSEIPKLIKELKENYKINKTDIKDYELDMYM